MAGLPNAAHTELEPDARVPLLIPVSRPVQGRGAGSPKLTGNLVIRLKSGSVAAKAYGKLIVRETFGCNYELNPEYRALLEGSGLAITGENEHGDARLAEIPGHRYFIGTGFIPQLSSTSQSPHPLITAFLKAALAFGNKR